MHGSENNEYDDVSSDQRRRVSKKARIDEPCHSHTHYNIESRVGSLANAPMAIPEVSSSRPKPTASDGKGKTGYFLRGLQGLPSIQPLAPPPPTILIWSQQPRPILSTRSLAKPAATSPAHLQAPATFADRSQAKAKANLAQSVQPQNDTQPEAVAIPSDWKLWREVPPDNSSSDDSEQARYQKADSTPEWMTLRHPLPYETWSQYLDRQVNFCPANREDVHSRKYEDFFATFPELKIGSETAQ